MEGLFCFRLSSRMLLISSILIKVGLLISKNYKKHWFRLGILDVDSSCSIQLSPTTFQTVFFSSDIDRSGSIQLDQFIKVYDVVSILSVVSYRIATWSDSIQCIRYSEG